MVSARDIDIMARAYLSISLKSTKTEKDLRGLKRMEATLNGCEMFWDVTRESVNESYDSSLILIFRLVAILLHLTSAGTTVESNENLLRALLLLEHWIPIQQDDFEQYLLLLGDLRCLIVLEMANALEADELTAFMMVDLPEESLARPTKANRDRFKEILDNELDIVAKALYSSSHWKTQELYDTIKNDCLKVVAWVLKRNPEFMSTAELPQKQSTPHHIQHPTNNKYAPPVDINTPAQAKVISRQIMEGVSPSSEWGSPANLYPPPLGPSPSSILLMVEEEEEQVDAPLRNRLGQAIVFEDTTQDDFDSFPVGVYENHPPTSPQQSYSGDFIFTSSKTILPTNTGRANISIPHQQESVLLNQPTGLSRAQQKLRAAALSYRSGREQPQERLRAPWE